MGEYDKLHIWLVSEEFVAKLGTASMQWGQRRLCYDAASHFNVYGRCVGKTLDLFPRQKVIIILYLKSSSARPIAIVSVGWFCVTPAYWHVYRRSCKFSKFSSCFAVFELQKTRFLKCRFKGFVHSRTPFSHVNLVAESFIPRHLLGSFVPS